MCVCVSPGYLQPLSDSLQHVGDDGVVPEVGEPNPGALHIHGTGQEESWPWRSDRGLVRHGKIEKERLVRLVSLDYGGFE